MYLSNYIICTWFTLLNMLQIQWLLVQNQRIFVSHWNIIMTYMLTCIFAELLFINVTRYIMDGIRWWAAVAIGAYIGSCQVQDHIKWSAIRQAASHQRNCNNCFFPSTPQAADSLCDQFITIRPLSISAHIAYWGSQLSESTFTKKIPGFVRLATCCQMAHSPETSNTYFKPEWNQLVIIVITIFIVKILVEFQLASIIKWW